MNEYRCHACRTLFFKGDWEGEIEVKCGRCNAYTYFDRRATFTASNAKLLDTSLRVGVASN